MKRSFCTLFGYLIVSIPIIIILWVVLSNYQSKAPQVQENFLGMERFSSKAMEMFESMFFSPGLEKVGVEAGIMAPTEGRPVEVGAASIAELGADNTIPGTVNITSNPDVCDATTMNCTNTKRVEGSPLLPIADPYAPRPIGNLDGIGIRDGRTVLGILAGDAYTKKLAGQDRATAVEPDMDTRCKLVPGGTSCPEGYNLGGTFGIVGAKLQCNVQPAKRQAKAVARIKDGEVLGILVMDSGEGYSVAPDIIITGGGGQGASGVAFIDDDGCVKVIEIHNGGSGYSSTPDIQILTSSGSDMCQLCCRI